MIWSSSRLCEIGTHFTYKVKQSLGVLTGTTVQLCVCCLVTDASVASECFIILLILVTFLHERVVKSEWKDGTEEWWGYETDVRVFLRTVGEVITAWQSRCILPSHDSRLASTVWNVAHIKSSGFVRAAAQSPVGLCWHVKQWTCLAWLGIDSCRSNKLSNVISCIGQYRKSKSTLMCWWVVELKGYDVICGLSVNFLIMSGICCVLSVNGYISQ